MIRNESEYQEARRRINEESMRLRNQRAAYEKEGFDPEEIKRLTDPFLTFHLQLCDEIQAYEQLQRGNFPIVSNLHGVGRLLVALRIASGITQRELAKRLGVNESMVSRDERNEYHGITVERAARIMDALETKFVGHVEEAPKGISDC